MIYCPGVYHRRSFVACYSICSARKSAYVQVAEEGLDSMAAEVEEANEKNNHKESWQLINPSSTGKIEKFEFCDSNNSKFKHQ